ncbi:MAG: hypothetical protein WCP28_07190 [Actinomycetes bacterium]
MSNSFERVWADQQREAKRTSGQIGNMTGADLNRQLRAGLNRPVEAPPAPPPAPTGDDDQAAFDAAVAEGVAAELARTRPPERRVVERLRSGSVTPDDQERRDPNAWLREAVARGR